MIRAKTAASSTDGSKMPGIAWSDHLQLVLKGYCRCPQRNHLTLVERADWGADHASEAHQTPDVWTRKTRLACRPDAKVRQSQFSL